jgi:hypothetical protein
MTRKKGLVGHHQIIPALMRAARITFPEVRIADDQDRRFLADHRSSRTVRQRQRSTPLRNRLIRNVNRLIISQLPLNPVILVVNFNNPEEKGHLIIL